MDVPIDETQAQVSFIARRKASRRRLTTGDDTGDMQRTKYSRLVLECVPLVKACIMSNSYNRHLSNMSLAGPQQLVRIALFWTGNNVLKWLVALSTCCWKTWTLNISQINCARSSRALYLIVRRFRIWRCWSEEPLRHEPRPKSTLTWLPKW